MRWICHEVATRVIFMDEGQIKEQGTPEEFFETEGSEASGIPVQDIVEEYKTNKERALALYENSIREDKQ